MLSLAVEACNDTSETKEILVSAVIFEATPYLRSFLESKVPRATLAGKSICSSNIMQGYHGSSSLVKHKVLHQI